MTNLNFLDFEPSSYCGAKCLMCPHEDSKYKNVNMSFDIFKKALDEAALNFGLESIRFCGLGDPFSDANLLEKLKYAKTRFPDISISVSNTLHIYKEELTGYIDSMSISNYGASKGVYEAVHGGALKYEEVVGNIERLLSLPRGSRPYVTMSFLVLPENEHEQSDWIAMWESKADEIMVWKPHSWAGSLTDIGGLIERVGKPRSCGRPFNKDILIKSTGLVTVCCHDYNCELSIGDLNHSSLQEILDGDKLKAIQKIHSLADFHGGGLICENCDQIYDRSNALVYTSSGLRVDSINLGGKIQRLAD